MQSQPTSSPQRREWRERLAPSGPSGPSAGGLRLRGRAHRGGGRLQRDGRHGLRAESVPPGEARAAGLRSQLLSGFVRLGVRG